MTETPGSAPAMTTRLDRWMRLVRDADLDGWLVADFRWNNPILGRLLGLGGGILTRRAFLWLPAEGRGEPLAIAARTDGHTLSELDCPTELYGGFEEMVGLLGRLLPSGGRVAMEYVERGALPTVSRVDAGMVELVRAMGVEVVSSGGLISALEVWDERQQELHRRAARGVDEARALALRRCGELLGRGERVTEGMLEAFIREVFAGKGVEANAGPDVAVNANAADPHYAAAGEGAEIGREDVLLIDLWAQVSNAAGAPYADSTWMAFTGPKPPAEVLGVFAAVAGARDAAIAAIELAAEGRVALPGREVDRVARAAIEEAGMEEYLIHRTGHSLGIDHVQGMGTNLDDVEFPDDRLLLPGSGFTVEPGLYLPGRFGVRLEVSAILQSDRLEVTTENQAELTRLS